MKVLVLDDELKSREVLKTLLVHFCPQVTTVETVDNIVNAHRLIKSFKPNLVFLDISLREGDSFSLLNNIEKIDFEFAFITAYDEISLRALQFVDLPCLLKPIQIDDLISIVESFADKSNKGISALKYQKVKTLLSSGLNKIPIDTCNGVIQLDVSKLLKLQKSENKTMIYLTDDEVLESETDFRKFENLLDQKIFKLTLGHDSVLQRILQY
jgi:two-component system LytT family response regulator